jgi:hypothetical protein
MASVWKQISTNGSYWSERWPFSFAFYFVTQVLQILYLSLSVARNVDKSVKAFARSESFQNIWVKA